MEGACAMDEVPKKSTVDGCKNCSCFTSHNCLSRKPDATADRPERRFATAVDCPVSCAIALAAGTESALGFTAETSCPRQVLQNHSPEGMLLPRPSQ
eukprot:6489589-Amphidinium_carterae.1